YETRVFNNTDSAHTSSSAAAAQINMTGDIGIGNATTESGNFEVTLWNQTSTAFHTQISYYGSYMDTSTRINSVTVSVASASANYVDFIRFVFSAGNISAGSYAVYGLA